MTENQNQTTTTAAPETKFCKECGQKIAARAVVCPHCGCQVAEVQQAAPQIVVNNTNTNTNANVNAHVGTPKNKWVALLLWFFLGGIGAHKFYEGKVGMGIIYFLTGALFGIGWVVDFFGLIFKPNTYYV